MDYSNFIFNIYFKHLFVLCVLMYLTQIIHVTYIRISIKVFWDENKDIFAFEENKNMFEFV